MEISRSNPKTGADSLRGTGPLAGAQMGPLDPRSAAMSKGLVARDERKVRLDGAHATLEQALNSEVDHATAARQYERAGKELQAFEAQVRLVKNGAELRTLKSKVADCEAKLVQAGNVLQLVDMIAAAGGSKAIEAMPWLERDPRGRAVVRPNNAYQDFVHSQRGLSQARPEQPNPRTLSGQLTLAERARERIDWTLRDVQSTNPIQKANAIAAHLDDPGRMVKVIRQLGPIQHAPVLDAVKIQTQMIANYATTQALGEALKACPDIRRYDPAMTKTLLALRNLQDPHLAAPIAAISHQALNDAKPGANNPLAAANVERNPDAARLIAPQSQGNDPRANNQMRALICDAATQSLNKRLADAPPGEAGVKQAMEKFQHDMQELAKTGVDVAMIAVFTKTACTSAHEAIVKKVLDGKSYFQRATDFVNGLVGAVVTSVEDFTLQAAEYCLKDVDAALDQSILGSDKTVFEDANAGMMGMLLTNRLDMGEGVAIALAANGKIGGVDVGGGATMALKRVPKTDAEGRDLPAVNGVPPSLIQITLSVESKVGLGITASFCKSTDAKKEGGAKISAAIQSEVGLQGQATFTMTFDATNPEDMKQLCEMFKEGASAGLKASIPGIGPLLASANAAEVASIGWQHRESLRIDAGGYGSLEAELQLGGSEKPTKGIAVEHPFQKKAEADKDGKAEEPTSPEQPAVASGVKVGARGEVTVGKKYDLQTGDISTLFNRKGEVQVQVNVGDATMGKGQSYKDEIEVRRDDQGKVKGGSLTQEYNKAGFNGLGRQDINGRVPEGKLAQVKEEDTIAVTSQLTPEALKDLADKSDWQIVNHINKSDTPDNKALKVNSVVTTHTTSVEASATAMGVGVTVQIEHTQDKVLYEK